jgi:hypothetical protein
MRTREQDSRERESRMITKTTGSKRVYACELHARLVANTDALFANEIDHDRHALVNGRIWREIESSGLQVAVSALIRGDRDDFDQEVAS